MKQEVISPHIPPSPRVLLVEDSLPERGMLREALQMWGYRVREASSAEEALGITQTEVFDIILSDWVMPGLSGPELCRQLRAQNPQHYAYFILITAKSEKSDIALGLDAGADDLLSKPVTFAELHARLRAGERLLQVQRELQDKNQLLSTTLCELRQVHASLDRDLAEARRLQQAQVRTHQRDLKTLSVSQLLLPSGQIGGDLVGYLPLSHNRLGFYSIDVSGHGVASALMAARLAGILTAATRDMGNDPRAIMPPEVFASWFNETLLQDDSLEQYCTCVFGDMDLRNGHLRLVQAGHPHPLLIGADNTIRSLGQGGLPLGLFPQAEWERVECVLRPGDQLLILTDGLLESHDAQNRPLGVEGIKTRLRALQPLRGITLLQTLAQEVRAQTSSPQADDISGLILDWQGLEQV